MAGVGGDVVWRESHAIYQKCKLIQPLWKTVWRLLKKLKIELPYDPATPFLDIYPNKMKTLMWKDICTPVFTVTLFKIAKMWKQPKCPSIDEWTKDVTYIYTHTHTHYMCICIRTHTHTHTHTHGLPRWLSGKESTCNAGNMGLTPGSGRPPGEGKGNPLQCYCLGYLMDSRAWQAILHGVSRVRQDLATK